MHSGTITALATCAFAVVQFSVAAFGRVWLYGQATRNAGPLAVLATVIFTNTATGLIGMPQFVLLPPWAVKLLAGLAASQLRVSPAASVPPPPERESTTRHGVTGVYTRSSAISPSAF